MKSTPIVQGDIISMAIGYTYNSQKVLGFIANEGYVNTNPDDTFLPHFTDTYYNISILIFVCHFILGSYFNKCNVTDNKNKVRKYDPALEEYWVTQSGYFIFTTIMVLSMGITNLMRLLYNGISEQKRENKIPMREYNIRAVYDLFKNTLPVDYGIPYLNTLPMPIDDSLRPNKKSCYTPEPLPDDIYVASKTSVINLNNHCESPNFILLTYITRDEHDCGNLKIGYCARCYYGMIFHKYTRLYSSACYIYKMIYYCNV